MWSYFCRPRCKIIFFLFFVLLCPTHFSVFPQQPFSRTHCSFFVVPSEMMDRGFTVFPKHMKILLCLSLKGTFFYFFYLPKFLVSNNMTDFNINFFTQSHCNTYYNKPINYNHLSNIHTYVYPRTCAYVCVCVCVCVYSLHFNSTSTKCNKEETGAMDMQYQEIYKHVLYSSCGILTGEY